MLSRGQASKGEMAAVRRFPAEHLKIAELIARDGDFRDMCEELADAEAALEAADRLPAAVRDERRAEWLDIIDRQLAQIANSLWQPADWKS